VKQYATDVFILLLFYHLAFISEKHETRQLLISTGLGSIAIWFSHIAVIAAFVCGLYMLYVHVFQQKRIKQAVPVFFWAISFGIYYVFFIHDHPHTD
jgi:hypothetical protein